MNLKEISYLTNLDSPLAQAKSLANHGQEITKKKTKEKNAREKTIEKNRKKSLKTAHCSSGTAAAPLLLHA
jgi:hypothetical protein